MSWNVDFDAVNVEGNEANLAELRRLGAPNVPAVAVAGRIVHGWQPRMYAELVGVPYDGSEMLPPDELRRRLDTVLELTQAALRQTPEETLEVKAEGRDRTLRNLGYHVFRVAAAFLDCLEQRRFLADWFREDAPETMRSGADLAAHGAKVRHRLAAWFATAPAEGYGAAAETYYGQCTVHELLERTTWHAAQHMRQIHHLLEEAEVLPAAVVEPAVYEGLPLPREMW